VPGAEVELTPGAGRGRTTHLDISRIREDTGYEPAYGIDGGMADYVAWLRSGHAA
jgi:UDP-glucose 4-epimerase